MPVFHTKTIESILDPVAQQVSRLVILHEEAEDGNAMPDLSRPVQAVSMAVANLVKVGKETINSSDDALLKQDMPGSLHRVEGASRLLEEASVMLKQDPYSGPARKKLIEGSRGILQGTSSLLLCFDESEVRKIIRECKRVLDYLAVAEVIETMEDLVHFLKNLSPCLSKVSREVSAREKELTHQVHREILVRCLEQVKTLAPILICSMKIFIHIISHGGKGAEEAAENRNYLSGRMSDELNEIIRVLQLTTYDEEEWDADHLTVLKKAQSAIESRIREAFDWLDNGSALRGGVGEKSIRQILDQAQRLADRYLPPSQAEPLAKLASEITTMTNALCELRQQGKGNSPQAEALARGIKEKLNQLRSNVASALVAADKSGTVQAAHTVTGRLEQANKWLLNPQHDDKGLGRKAIALIVHEGKKVADGLPGIHKAEILQLCDEVESLSRQLEDLCHRGQGSSPQAQEIARQLSYKLHELKNKIQQAVVSRVVEDFIDITTPLKQFTEAVLAPEGTPNREQNFNDKTLALQTFSNRAAKTARMVAAGGSGGNKKLAEALTASSSQIESLTPQLVNAGRIRMTYPESKAADEHFENLRQQYADTIQRVRALCDEATDSGDFIKTSEEQMQKHSFLCEEAIAKSNPQKMVDNTSAIARLANRVILVAKQESDNSEDPAFIERVNRAADALQNAVAPMVQDAKRVAMNTNDGPAVSKWRESNRNLLGAVGQVRKAVTADSDVIQPPSLSQLHIGDANEVTFADLIHLKEELQIVDNDNIYLGNVGPSSSYHLFKIIPQGEKNNSDTSQLVTFQNNKPIINNSRPSLIGPKTRERFKDRIELLKARTKPIFCDDYLTFSTKIPEIVDKQETVKIQPEIVKKQPEIVKKQPEIVIKQPESVIKQSEVVTRTSEIVNKQPETVDKLKECKELDWPEVENFIPVPDVKCKLVPNILKNRTSDPRLLKKEPRKQKIEPRKEQTEASETVQKEPVTEQKEPVIEKKEIKSEKNEIRPVKKEPRKRKQDPSTVRQDARPEKRVLTKVELIRIELSKRRQLNEVLCQWFLRERYRGTLLNEPMIQTKAIALKEKIGGTEFTPTSEWFQQWKTRYDIRLPPENSTEDQGTVEFIRKLKELIRNEGYTKEQIFNCGVTGLNYRLLPTKKLDMKLTKECITRYWENTDRLTFMCCSNASGSIKFPLMVIGTPESLNKTRVTPQDLPVDYQQHPKVGEPLRNQPSPSNLRVISPMENHKPLHRPVSPLPKWARGGDNPDLLYQDLASVDELEKSDRAREMAPPRPPLPSGDIPPPRPPPPETDDEDEMFMHAPLPNQPIMMAAHGLHQEVRQWSSKDNEIIAAAKKMAILMGRLSGLVRGEGGNKRDLIACAKAIAEASQEVTRLAKELARECTDKRIRTNLLQVCERIPTIGTQLKILSTVKATMLGAQGTEEDQEATDMLVGNAQNLMQSVKETVRAAECASIKIRTASGMKLRWVRRQPWYQY